MCVQIVAVSQCGVARSASIESSAVARAMRNVESADAAASLHRMLEMTAARRNELYVERDRLQEGLDQYTHLAASLVELPDKVESPALVPFGSLAYFPGSLVHTNELTVLLGANYFAKCSATQAARIAHSRAEQAQEQLSEREGELDGLSARIEQLMALARLQGGDAGTREIREYEEDDQPAAAAKPPPARTPAPRAQAAPKAQAGACSRTTADAGAERQRARAGGSEEAGKPVAAKKPSASVSFSEDVIERRGGPTSMAEAEPKATPPAELAESFREARAQAAAQAKAQSGGADADAPAPKSRFMASRR